MPLPKVVGLKDGVGDLGRMHRIVRAVRVVPGAEDFQFFQVLLTDHHYWGGLRRTRELAAVREAFGIGLSMHSNSHLGISLAALTHVAAAIPNLNHSCDTPYPWNRADDAIVPGVLEIAHGEVEVPTGPGPGVELGPDAVDRLRRRCLDSGVRRRDDTGYKRRIRPEYELRLPRW